eukprot:TRINITY_DN67583_c0_g1_i1.p1 TRINITY_DN67583_c0_g1~~TRINITY_DN67583_c0_g1_i1.p1  ORF type:complete len:236 (+),score=33.55 TRINITY_DN67583_c0_g1_i1:182-889(+)
MVAATARRTSRLLLIRHGETAWNAEGRLQGQLDVALNTAGVEQAQRAAEALRRRGVASSVDAIVSSDLSRARATADAIASVCPGALRREDPRLREVHAGAFQGQLLSDLGKEREEVSQCWLSGDLDAAHPGENGESARDVIRRGLEGLRCAAELGSCVVVVAHGGVIRWCAVSIELGGQLPSPEAYRRPNVSATLRAPLRNCCCSTVLYDHASQTFTPERWFVDLEGPEALDDTG